MGIGGFMQVALDAFSPVLITSLTWTIKKNPREGLVLTFSDVRVT